MYHEIYLNCNPWQGHCHKVHSLKQLSKGQMISFETVEAWCLFAVAECTDKGARASCWFPGRHWEKLSVWWCQVFSSGRAAAQKQLALILVRPSVIHSLPVWASSVLSYHRKLFKMSPGFTPAFSLLITFHMRIASYKYTITVKDNNNIYNIWVVLFGC